MTKTERTCPRCGLVFVSEKLDGLCPACLLGSLFDESDADDSKVFWEDETDAGESPPHATPPAPVRRFSHFEILEELGRGGMGIVYRARDVGTGRIIALKVLQAHHLEVPDLVTRFRSEVRAVTSLDHPNVLPVHEVGEYEGIPFFSMKLTTGGSLAQRVGDYLGRPTEIARLLAKVARGVAHAHERGILHRDLKPGNILLDSAGEPYVCDFGLAKWIEDDRNLTITSAVLGTPHYIAPEQASGKKGLTTAADIYSLGAIIYELLTARPPFVGQSIIETLRLASENTPERPSSLAQNIPKDLETICLKCLEREPASRYVSATALAIDLENWLEGRPILARPVGAAEQLWRWAQRNPLPAALIASVAMLLVATAVVSTFSAININQARKETREQLYSALLAQAKAARLTGRAGQRFDALEALGKAAKIHASIEVRTEVAAALALADFKIEREWKLGTTSRPTRAFDASLEHVFDEITPGVVRIFRLSDETEVARLSEPSSPKIDCILPPSGDLLAVRYVGGIIKVWDLKTHTKRYELTNCSSGAIAPWYSLDCTFSPDRQFLAVGSKERGGITLFAAKSGQELRHIVTSTPASCLAFSPDSRRIAVGSVGSVHLSIYETAGNAEPFPISVPSPVYHVAWHPDGTQLAAASSDFSIYLCDSATPEPLGVLKGHRQEVTQVIFTGSGNRLVSTGRDRSIRLWSISALTEEVFLMGYGSEPAMRLAEDGGSLAVTDASPNAYKIVIGGSDPLCRTMVNGAKIGRATLVGSIAFFSDGKQLVTSSFESIDLWDAEEGSLTASFSLDAGAEKSVRFGNDPQTLLIGSRLSGLAYYRVSGRRSFAKLSLGERLDTQAGFIFSNTPPGDRNLVGLTASQAGVARVFDLTTRQDLFELGDIPFVWDLALSPDQKWLALAFSNQASESKGHIQIWSLNEKKHILTLPGGRNNIARFTPDGNWLKSSGEILRDSAWSTHTWSPSKTSNYAGSWHVFSEAGNWAAGLSLEKDRILIMELKSGRLLFALEPPILPGSNFRLASSPNGKYLAAQSDDNTVWIWNLDRLRNSLQEFGL